MDNRKSWEIGRREFVITVGLVAVAATAVLIATVSGRLTPFAPTPPDHPMVQVVPPDVEQHLRAVGGLFEIRGVPTDVAIAGQVSVATVARATGVRTSRASAVHGDLILADQPTRSAWLVVIDGTRAAVEKSGEPKRVSVFGFVDATDGTTIWVQTLSVP